MGKAAPPIVSPSDHLALGIQKWLDTLGSDLARFSEAPEESGALIGWGSADLIWDAIAETPGLIDYLRTESGEYFSGWPTDIPSGLISLQDSMAFEPS